MSECTDINERNEEGERLITYLARIGNLKYFKCVLCLGATFKSHDYDDATVGIKRFLDYRPGASEDSIRNYCLKSDSDIKRILALTLDQEDTTSAESSSSESEDENLKLSKAEKAKYNKTRKELIKQFNADSDSDSDDDETDDDETDDDINDRLQITTYRGIHFSPKVFTKDMRKIARNNLEGGKAIVSRATAQDAGYEADDDADENDKELKKAHKKIIKFFDNMRDENDRDERIATSRNKTEFSNLYYRFVQAYVMNYDRLFNKGEIVKDFEADTKKNPIVSTSYKPDRAMIYSSGMRHNPKQFGSNRLDPHYRRSTGKAKHPHLGFIDIFSMNPSYFQANGQHILDMIHRGEISISHLYKFEYEVFFESMIPGEYHSFREILTLPRFDKEYNEEFKEKYGFTKNLYTRIKNRLMSLTEHRNSEEYSKIVNDIIEHIIKYRAKVVKEKIDYNLYHSQNKQYAAYPAPDDKLSTELIVADSPRWSKK